MVTTSTRSWVTARSGAESQTKDRQVTTPTPPTRTSAAKRWYFACQAAAIAQAAPTSQSSAKSGSKLGGVRGSSRSAPQSAETASAKATEDEDAELRSAAARCRARGRPRRAQIHETLTSRRSKMRCPRSGADERRALRPGGDRVRRGARRAAVPPARAIRLITSGKLTPCQTLEAVVRQRRSPSTETRGGAQVGPDGQRRA